MYTNVNFPWKCRFNAISVKVCHRIHYASKVLVTSCQLQNESILKLNHFIINFVFIWKRLTNPIYKLSFWRYFTKSLRGSIAWGSPRKRTVNCIATLPLSYANPDFPNIVLCRGLPAIAAINNPPYYKYESPSWTV